MTKKFTLLSLLAIIFSHASFSQFYQPFMEGRTYHYQDAAGDIHSAYLTGDSLGTGETHYFLNEVCRHTSDRGLDCHWFFDYVNFLPNQDNVWGASMIARPEGEYLLTSNTGDTIWLKTQVPVGSSWVYASSTSDMVTLVSKAPENVLGTMDTVLTYEVSGSFSLKISRNFGLIHSPLKMFPVTAVSDSWELIEIPELNLGNKFPDFARIFNFEVGDHFVRVVEDYDYGMQEQTWYDLRVQSKTVNADSTHFSYTMSQRKAFFDRYAGGDTTYYPHEIITEEYKIADYPILNGYRLENHSETVNTFTGPSLIWNNRLERRYASFLSIGCDNDSTGEEFVHFLGSTTYSGIRDNYVEGLGVTRSGPPVYGISTRLTCYEKGSESAGGCNEALFDSAPLGVDEVVRANYQSSTSTLEVWVVKNAVQAISVYSMDGRLVADHVVDSSLNHHEITLRPLAKGIYVVAGKCNGRMVGYNKILVRD